MDKLSDVFAIRMRIDAKHQPRHGGQIQSLARFLEDGGYVHPYGPGCQLEREPAYRMTCAGLAAKTDPLAFAYRLTSVGALIRNAEARPPYRTETVLTNWLSMSEDYRRQDTWLPVSNYAAGQLTAKRGFNWWTPFDLSDRTVISNAHRVGMPNDWITPYAVLLRLDLSAFRVQLRGFVPTVLDGFDSVIFLSTRDSLHPPMGVAIDLRTPARLCLGAEEFILNPIPVEALSFKPVLVDESTRSEFRVDLDDLIDPLLKFYAAEDGGDE